MPINALRGSLARISSQFLRTARSATQEKANASSTSPTPSRGPWVLDPTRVFDPFEVGRVLASARSTRDLALKEGRCVEVRDAFVVELAFASGLRVAELAHLACSDVVLRSPAAIVVRCGKGSRSRVVNVSSRLRASCEQFLAWKASRGEDVSHDAPLFKSSVTGQCMTTRALQLSFRRSLRRAGVAHRGIHCARHSYATELYRCSNNLRLVQRQLGHASLATTQIYLALFDAQVLEAVENLYADADVAGGAA